MMVSLLGIAALFVVGIGLFAIGVELEERYNRLFDKSQYIGFIPGEGMQALGATILVVAAICALLYPVMRAAIILF